MAKDNNKKNLGNKKNDRNCKAKQNDDQNNSVEFANEPFNEERNTECKADKKNDNRCQ